MTTLPRERCEARRRSASAVVLTLALALVAIPVRAEERVDLRPEAAASRRSLASALRPAAWRAPRTLRIDTAPSGAELELSYSRAGVQLRRARGRAPLAVVLPSAADTSTRDTLSVVAALAGHRTEERVTPAESAGQELTIALRAVPNRVVGASLFALGGRFRLTLLSSEPLAARLETTRDGWRVVAAGVALDESASAMLAALAARAPLRVDARSLGEDLVLELEAARARRAGYELRATTHREPVRALHRYVLEGVPADGGVAADAALHAALAALSPDDVGGCAAAFDRTLREQLDLAALSRALSPTGGFGDAYLAAALLRLAELSPDGALRMLDGARLAPARPLELARALAQPEQALGLLAALRGVVARLEAGPAREAALAAWIAPEMPAVEFASAIARAAEAERSCAPAS